MKQTRRNLLSINRNLSAQVAASGEDTRVNLRARLAQARIENQHLSTENVSFQREIEKMHNEIGVLKEVAERLNAAL